MTISSHTLIQQAALEEANRGDRFSAAYEGSVSDDEIIRTEPARSFDSTIEEAEGLDGAIQALFSPLYPRPGQTMNEAS